MGKMAIIISATPLNRTGKEPGTGALSHSFANQIQYFGLKATRLITGLFKGVATTNSSRSNWAGGFLLTEKTKPADVASIHRLLTDNERRASVMADSILTLPLDESNFDHLTEAELSRLLDLLTSQIEYHRDELTRLRPLLHRLQGQIPIDDPFKDFLETLNS